MTRQSHGPSSQPLQQLSAGLNSAAREALRVEPTRVNQDPATAVSAATETASAEASTKGRSQSLVRRNHLWNRLLLQAYTTFGRFPLLRTALVRIWWQISWRLFQLRRTLRNLVRSFQGVYLRELDNDQVHWVSPARIRYSGLVEFDVNHFKGSVLPGEWDRPEIRFEELDVYTACRQVLIEGASWPQTVFYQRILARINHGETPWACQSQADLDRRCEKLAALAENIRHNGYKSQQELASLIPAQSPFLRNDEITVSIGRDGELLFSNGAHRLSIAKLLAVPAVPVLVAVRHPEWLELRRQLEQYAQEQGGMLPQPVTHPDLAHIPAAPASSEMLAAILNELAGKPGPVLTINEELGTFCHRLEDAGFECYGYQQDEQLRTLMKKLRRAEGKRFQIVGPQESGWQALAKRRFTAMVALSGFGPSGDSHVYTDEFIALLCTVQTDMLFLQASPLPAQTSPASGRHDGAGKVIQILLDNAIFAGTRLVATTSSGQQLYVLYR
jgi:hypothetical protein